MVKFVCKYIFLKTKIENKKDLERKIWGESRCLVWETWNGNGEWDYGVWENISTVELLCVGPGRIMYNWFTLILNDAGFGSTMDTTNPKSHVQINFNSNLGICAYLLYHQALKRNRRWRKSIRYRIFSLSKTWSLARGVDHLCEAFIIYQWLIFVTKFMDT